MNDTVDGTFVFAIFGALIGLGILWFVLFTSVRAALRSYGRDAGWIPPRPDSDPNA